jgi:hypothetical protein
MDQLPRRAISMEGLYANVPKMSRDVYFLVAYLAIMPANKQHSADE